MSRILVTGASGFVGRHTLPHLLSSGFEVHATSFNRNSTQPKQNRLVWHEGVNLLSADSTTALVDELKPDHLLHLAWHTAPGEYWTSDKNLEWVSASLHLLKCFARNGGKRAVMAGSCAEYDWTSGNCIEDVTPLAPSTLYGNCKHALHMIFSSFAEKHEISWAWGRIFYVFGPYEYRQRLVPSIINPLLSGQPATCFHSSQQRDFMFVDDVGRAFAKLAGSEMTGAINIGSGEAISVKEFSELIASELNAGELLRFENNPPTTPGAPLVVADATRLHNQLGFTPATKIVDGIQQTIEWWKQEGAKVAAGAATGR